MVTTITPTIVTLNVTQTIAPTPSQLQQSGAVVSCGGTTLTTGTYSYCGTPAAAVTLLATPLSITGLVWSGSTVTATVAAMTLAVGQTFLTTISGAVPAAYNGTYTATVASSTTFTYALASNPGSETSPGTYTPPYSAFIANYATTHFAQGTAVGFYILELGAESTATAGITALGTWITANSNPQVFYIYRVDASWDSSALATLAGNYSSPNGRTYFVATTTTGTMGDYSSIKSVLAVVRTPGEASTVDDAAPFMYQMLANAPTAANPAGPLAFRYVYGVSSWPVNSSSLPTILTAYANYIGTGSEGGISTALLRNGTTMDGTQFMWWYGIDWLAIQIKQALAAAVINGSNQNPPLIYNQPGINALQAVAQDVCNSFVAFQLGLSATVFAQSFVSYTAQNPNDYRAGIYAGFSCTAVGANGFLKLTFDLNAVQFA